MSRRLVLLCSSLLVLSLLAVGTPALSQGFAPAPLPLWSRYRPHMWLRAHLARLGVVPPLVAYSRPVYVTPPAMTAPWVVASVNAAPVAPPPVALSYAPPPPPGYVAQSHSTPPVYAAPGDASPPVAYAEHTAPTPPQATPSDRFYCADSQAWYPDVMNCADGWQRVPVRPR
jgi:hypothetical protein